MVRIQGVAKKTGLSWAAVFSFSLLLAFILYIASTGSLAKYKEFLFGSVGSSGSMPSSATGQGVAPSSQSSSSTSSNSGGSITDDINEVGELAGVVSSFV